MYYYKFLKTSDNPKHKANSYGQLNAYTEADALKQAETNVKIAHDGIKMAAQMDAETYPVRDCTIIIYDPTYKEIGSITVTETGNILYNLKEFENENGESK